MAAVDEEKKNAVRKLEAEKQEFKTENETLKKKIQELERPKSTRPRVNLTIDIYPQKFLLINRMRKVPTENLFEKSMN